MKDEDQQQLESEGKREDTKISENEMEQDDTK